MLIAEWFAARADGVDRAANVYTVPPNLTNWAVRKGFSVRCHITKVMML